MYEYNLKMKPFWYMYRLRKPLHVHHHYHCLMKSAVVETIGTSNKLVVQEKVYAMETQFLHCLQTYM